jgi:RNA polymerase sigma-70 factor (ECF subfamily)
MSRGLDAQRSEANQAGESVQAAFERCGQALCRFFSVRVGSHTHVVDDLMQQLWLRSRLAAGDLRGPAPEPWLWRIAQNLLREHQRNSGASTAQRAVADPALARRLARQFDEQELPAEVLARREVADQVLLALSALPQAEQDLLASFYFEGRSQAELGVALGITERAVEGRLYRARLALRDKLLRLVED